MVENRLGRGDRTLMNRQSKMEEKRTFTKKSQSPEDFHKTSEQQVKPGYFQKKKERKDGRGGGEKTRSRWKGSTILGQEIGNRSETVAGGLKKK